LDVAESTKIVAYNGSKVKVDYNTTDSIHLHAKDHQLAISSKQHLLFINFGWFKPNPALTIYVPKKMKLKVLSGSAADTLSVSNLNFNQLNLKSYDTTLLTNVKVTDSPLTLKTTGGESILQNVVAPAIKLSAVNVDVELNNCNFTKSLSKISNINGDINVTNTTFKNLDTKSTNGDLDFYLNNKRNLAVNIANTSGDSEIFGENSTNYTSGDANIHYNLKSMNGDVTIR
jgi:DUF4097 and DUF4098 domain-containing protein YvlB